MSGYSINAGRLKALVEDVDGPVAAALESRAIKVENIAKRLAPVDTGRLRASIRHGLGVDQKGLYARVGTDVKYASYQEFGTRNMPAHPFLRPALSAAGGSEVEPLRAEGE